MLFNAPKRRRPNLPAIQYTEDQVRSAISRAIGQICTDKDVNLYAWEIEDAADNALAEVYRQTNNNNPSNQ